MEFNRDLLTAFKELSLLTQERYANLIGHRDNEVVLRLTVQELLDGKGQGFKTFLDRAICYDQEPKYGFPCESLMNYEEYNVIYDGVELFEHDLIAYPQLSSYLNEYIQEVLFQIDEFFPMEIGKNTHHSKIDLDLFEPMNQQKFPTVEEAKKNFQPGKIEPMARILSVPFQPEMQEEYENLVQKILYDQEVFCSSRKSDPILFWTHALRKYQDSLSPSLIRLILAANVSPLSSSDSERA